MPPPINPVFARIANLPRALQQGIVRNLPPAEAARVVDEIAQQLPLAPPAERARLFDLFRAAQRAMGGGPELVLPHRLLRFAPARRGDANVREARAAARPPPIREADADAPNVHRQGADKDTRESIGRMVDAFPVPADVPGTLDDIDAFIKDHFRNPAHNAGATLREDGSVERMEGPMTREDADARQAALRTISKDRSWNERYFGGIRDPQNTYMMPLAGKEVVIRTADVVAALWTATESLPAPARLDVRLKIALALASAQQNGIHICSPGQLQLIATHMQGHFPHLIDIRTPPKDPKDYNAQLYRFIQQASPKNLGAGLSRDDDAPAEVDGPLPEDKHQGVRDKATELWNEAAQQDTERQAKNWLTPRDAHARALELYEGMDLMLNGTYDLKWEPPHGTKPAKHFIPPAAPQAVAPVPNQWGDAERQAFVIRLAEGNHGALHREVPMENVFQPRHVHAIFDDPIDQVDAIHIAPRPGFFGPEGVMDIHRPFVPQPPNPDLLEAVHEFGRLFNVALDFNPMDHGGITVGEFVQVFARHLHAYLDGREPERHESQAFWRCTVKIASLLWGEDNPNAFAHAKDDIEQYLSMTYDWEAPNG